LHEASTALTLFRLESEEAVAELVREHASQLEASSGAHADEVARLQGEAAERLDELGVALASSQRESRAALEDLASSQRESRAALEARWTAEREELASSHAAELDKQNEAFEARLRDGREAFEAQLASSEHRFAEERRNLHARLEGNAEELVRSEESWKLSQEEALRCDGM